MTESEQYQSTDKMTLWADNKELAATNAALLKACKNALGAYSALKAMGADKELPGYESCLAFLKTAIRKATE